MTLPALPAFGLSRLGQGPRTTVFGLLRIGCPTTVPRLVMAARIYAVDGEPARPLAHVCKEVGEGQPPLAHSGAAAAVAIPVNRSRVRTARNHVAPRAVGPRPSATPTVAVRKVSETKSTHLLAVNAAAASAPAINELASWRGEPIAAVTNAQPAAIGPALAARPNDKKPSEPLSHELKRRRHRVGIAQEPGSS